MRAKSQPQIRRKSQSSIVSMSGRGSAEHALVARGARRSQRPPSWSVAERHHRSGNRRWTRPMSRRTGARDARRAAPRARRCGRSPRPRSSRRAPDFRPPSHERRSRRSLGRARRRASSCRQRPATPMRRAPAHADESPVVVGLDEHAAGVRTVERARRRTEGRHGFFPSPSAAEPSPAAEASPGTEAGRLRTSSFARLRR